MGTLFFVPSPFSFMKTIKEASAVCRSFLDGVVIFLMVSRSLLFAHINGTSSKVENLNSTQFNSIQFNSNQLGLR